MSYAKDKKDIDFAYKVRHALNESAENLPDSVLSRLGEARKMALANKKQEAPVSFLISKRILAGNAGVSLPGSKSWFGKLGLTLTMLALLIGLYAIYEHEQEQRINDLAEIDAAVLVDELPPDAYLDTGFNAYLDKVEE
jgi:hypothetical protein